MSLLDWPSLDRPAVLRQRGQTGGFLAEEREA